MDQPTGHNNQSNDSADGQFMHPKNTHADRDLFGNAPKGHANWNHRRGEPRMFTLLWMVYLMGATVLMFSSMATAYSISPEITRPAARTMLMVVVVGFSILWPMVRFSQYSMGNGHQRYVRCAMHDALVLYIPMQAVIWPQGMPILAGWPVEVIAAISAACLAWMVVLAGIVALGSASIHRNKGSDKVRVVWMLLVIGVVFAAPMVGGLGAVGVDAGVAQPRVGWLLSPVTGLLEITRDRRELGVSARVFADHWRMIIALMCVGGALLLIARSLELARAKYRA